jgi:hypothetical protein
MVDRVAMLIDDADDARTWPPELSPGLGHMPGGGRDSGVDGRAEHPLIGIPNELNDEALVSEAAQSLVQPRMEVLELDRARGMNDDAAAHRSCSTAA